MAKLCWAFMNEINKYKYEFNTYVTILHTIIILALTCKLSGVDLTNNLGL